MINIEQTSRCIQNKDRTEDINTSLRQAISSRVYCVHHVNQSSGTFHLITQITHTYKVISIKRNVRIIEIQNGIG